MQETCREWMKRIRVKHDMYGRMTSVTLRTRYGVLMFFDNAGRLDWRLIRRGFTRPTPDEIYFCCSKHTDETREAKGAMAEVEVMCCCLVERMTRIKLDELAEFMMDWCMECSVCDSCSKCSWEGPGLVHTGYINWDTMGVSVHPVPPDEPRDCYVIIRDKYGTRYYSGGAEPCIS